MSTAWYKPNRVPAMIRSWTTNNNTTGHHRRSIQVWETTCIVTNMNMNTQEDEKFTILMNSGNPTLCGVSKFAYFPHGGPEPATHFKIGKDAHPLMGYASQWGGMDVGHGMMFPANTIDGLLHTYGGTSLAEACARVLREATDEQHHSGTQQHHKGRIQEGSAVVTPCVGHELRTISGYDYIIHTVPPFYNHHSEHNDTTTRKDPQNNNTSHANDNIDRKKRQQQDDDDDEDRVLEEFLLAECYRNSLDLAVGGAIPVADVRTPTNTNTTTTDPPTLRIVCPLLGAGCRGFPIDTAIQIASQTTMAWMMQQQQQPQDATIIASSKIKTRIKMEHQQPQNRRSSLSSSSSSSSSSLLSLSAWWSSLWNEKLDDTDNDSSGTVNQQQRPITLAFGIPDATIRRKLIEALDRDHGKHNEHEKIRHTKV